MKLLPLTLPPVGAMDRLPLSLPFSPTDLLWRYPLGFSSPAAQPTSTPTFPTFDFKTHLPSSLASDPRVWSREDVTTFLRWCEREFDLPQFEMEMFQMNGKAICLLTKGDLAERCPGAGDVLHNVLQLLVRDAQSLQRCLPSSPVTPTSRHHPYAHQLSPHHAVAGSHPSTPTWSLIDFQAPNLAHLLHQGNSVTLSPAPSVDSQAGSPQHADHPAGSSYHSGGSNGSNQSDTDEDSKEFYHDNKTNILQGHSSPPATPGANTVAPPLPRPASPTKEQLNILGNFRPVRDFFSSDSPEPNTNGRLLWDFLQQLLNDPTQRYTNYIAWKNRDTGVFKIVDPAGLAKLWGIQKNHLSMNYDKMSRALRYYYRVNILRKVQGERHCYQFLRNPSELKSIKNMSLLRQQMSPTRPPALVQQQQQQQQTPQPQQPQQQQQQQQQQPQPQPQQQLQQQLHQQLQQQLQHLQHLQPPHHPSAAVPQMAHPATAMSIKVELMAESDCPAEEDVPTDLSMEHSGNPSPTDLSMEHPANHRPTDLSIEHPANSSSSDLSIEHPANPTTTDLSMEHPTDLSPTRPNGLTDSSAALLCHVVKVNESDASDEK